LDGFGVVRLVLEQQFQQCFCLFHCDGGLATQLVGRVQSRSESLDDRVVGAEQGKVAVVVLLQDLHRCDAAGGGRCGSEPLDLRDCSGETGPRGV